MSDTGPIDNSPPAAAPAHTPRRIRLLPLAAIGAIALTLAAAFAWSAGWIGGRLTAQRLVDAIESAGPPHPGFRRAHSKGVCVSGLFRSSGDAVALSSARVFAQPQTPVIGRLSIAGADPQAAEAQARVRSLALLLQTDDGQQWRTAMNSFPFFPVATPAGFLAQTLASQPDPATGKPDPARQAAFLRQYPEAVRFQEWARQAPWSDSWANTAYNSVNAFRVTAADGRTQYVRWSLHPQTPFAPLDAQRRSQAEADFLAQDLRARLAQGPLRWDLVLTVAEAGDAVNDASQPWPESRRQVRAGTVELSGSEPQAGGRCRDINFDPLILPHGIAASDDPILLARAAAYSQSFNRREREIAFGLAAEAAGKDAAP